MVGGRIKLPRGMVRARSTNNYSVFSHSESGLVSSVPSSNRYVRRSVSAQARSTEKKKSPHADLQFLSPEMCDIPDFPNAHHDCHQCPRRVYSQNPAKSRKKTSSPFPSLDLSRKTHPGYQKNSMIRS